MGVCGGGINVAPPSVERLLVSSGSGKQMDCRGTPFLIFKSLLERATHTEQGEVGGLRLSVHLARTSVSTLSVEQGPMMWVYFFLAGECWGGGGVSGSFPFFLWRLNTIRKQAVRATLLLTGDWAVLSPGCRA